MENIKKAVAKYSEFMAKAERYIYNNPEVGYKEFKTNAYMIEQFQSLGYAVKGYDGITGFNAYYDTGKAGATVLVLAELDSLICAEHPDCDKQTGAVHNCGHNVQCASILGVAAAIKESAINGELSGKVKFGIVPAEEGIELSYRNELIEKGIITFTSGKPECIKRGLLDDVDLAFMVHTKDMTSFGGKYYIEKGSNGVVRKKTVITGKAAHAGSIPWNGTNALFAAELALSATNALRETFKEEDFIRFHSIITKGGEAVNAVPSEVILESYVRGANPEAIRTTNTKINRAITGACLAMGANVKISDRAGSEPLFGDKNLTKVMAEVGAKLVGEEKMVVTDKWLAASTDMGDISCLVPSVHGFVDGSRGAGHSKDFRLENPAQICVDSASWQLATLVELLKNGCEKVYEIKSKFQPKYSSIKEYLEFKAKLSRDLQCIEYGTEKAIINY